MDTGARKINVSDRPQGRLTVECDEMSSFVDRKGNEWWVWLAIERKTREIIDCYTVFVHANLQRHYRLLYRPFIVSVLYI